MKEFKVVPIRNGTVLDHVAAGKALDVLAALGLPVEGSSKVVSVSMNLPSTTTGLKDVIKFEDLELDAADLEKVKGITSTGTVNVIRNFEIAEKAAWGL